MGPRVELKWKRMYCVVGIQQDQVGRTLVVHIGSLSRRTKARKKLAERP